MDRSTSIPIKIGIFFGGQSREREISFAGGRMVYDHLDRNIFEPIPIFIDSLGNFILLHWKYLYQGAIREFYPPAEHATHFMGIPLYIESTCINKQEHEKEKWLKSIGKKIQPIDFKHYFDMAFLCLHGPYGEDGSIQGLLKWYQMAYSGSSILPSALGIHKVFQHKLLKQADCTVAPALFLSKEEWLNKQNKKSFLDNIVGTIGLPFVVKSSTQGSSIGISIVHTDEIAPFIKAIDNAFFQEEITYASWSTYTLEDKKKWFNRLIDVREGIGFPLLIGNQQFYQPVSLLHYIDRHFQNEQSNLLLISAQAEEEIIIESFIKGREFSCIVLEEKKGKPIALVPTEIIKKNKHFDYRTKYLPGIVRKETPLIAPPSLLHSIRKKVIALFQLFHFQIYARIDGFLTPDNEIILNDPNTTSGMNFSSFLFHQAAEIGLNPTQLLTFIIKRSLEARKEEGYLAAIPLLERLISKMG